MDRTPPTRKQPQTGKVNGKDRPLAVTPEQTERCVPVKADDQATTVVEVARRPDGTFAPGHRKLGGRKKGMTYPSDFRHRIIQDGHTIDELHATVRDKSAPAVKVAVAREAIDWAQGATPQVRREAGREFCDRTEGKAVERSITARADLPPDPLVDRLRSLDRDQLAALADAAQAGKLDEVLPALLEEARSNVSADDDADQGG